MSINNESYILKSAKHRIVKTLFLCVVFLNLEKKAGSHNQAISGGRAFDI